MFVLRTLEFKYSYSYKNIGFLYHIIILFVKVIRCLNNWIPNCYYALSENVQDHRLIIITSNHEHAILIVYSTRPCPT